MIILYECGICDCLHPWNWNGDCREDQHRYADASDYAERRSTPEHEIEVRSWLDRQIADGLALGQAGGPEPENED